jgi:hypothetical protein
LIYSGDLSLRMEIFTSGMIGLLFFEPNKISVYIYPKTDTKHTGRHLGKRQLFLSLLSTICNQDKKRRLITKPSVLLCGYTDPNSVW